VQYYLPIIYLLSVYSAASTEPQNKYDAEGQVFWLIRFSSQKLEL